jgi:hypothetical protein
MTSSYALVDAMGQPLDLKLDALFGQKTGGVFIELGANDGLTQSNTAFFEFSRGWTGLLVEPVSYTHLTLPTKLL